MATVATISVNFAQYDSVSFTSTGVIDRSINPKTLSQYCLGASSGDLSYLGGFVKKTGDNMSGYLTLHTANPTLADHATRKGYVDSRIDSLSSTVNDTSAGGFVRIGGSTMVGGLILNTSSPALALQASSKGYVDTRITSLSSTVDTKLTDQYLARAGGTMLGTISMNGSKILALGTPTLASDAATKAYVDSSLTTATTDAATKTYVNTQDALKVAKAGDTMTGRLSQSDKGFHSALKDNITTRTDSGFFQTSVAKKSTGWPADTNGWYHLLTSTHYNDSNYYSMQFASQFDNSNELYYRSTNNNGNIAWNKIFHSGNTTTTSLIGYQPVNKAGDTMSGFLKLHSNPTDNAHAANKAYVDTAVSGASSSASGATSNANARVLKSGDTMTGNLTINNGSPTIYLQDSDNRSGMLHCNNNIFYVLRGDGNNSVNWSAVAGQGWPLELNLDNNNASFGGDVYSKGKILATQEAVNTKLNISGGTLTSFLSLHSNPTDNAHAANKAYVDTAVSGASSSASGATSNANTRLLRTGDTTTGILVGGGSTKAIGVAEGGTGALFEQKSEGSGATANAAYITFHRPNSYAVRFGLDTDNKLKIGGWSLGTNAYEIITSNNISSFAPTSTQVDAKVSKAGDTMSNFLNLHSNPTDNAHAANKAYVDTEVAKKTTSAYVDQEAGKRVLKSGDTMTGNLSINNGSPTIYLQDTDHRSAMIHCNENLLYILRGAVNGFDWSGNEINGRWPLVLSLLTGNLTVAGDVTAYSDSRLKKNVNPIENSLEKTLKLEGVSYEKTESSDKHIGLIAQKVKEVLPEVVHEDKDGYLTLAYGNIVGLLVEAIKELNTKVEKLENKNI